MTDLISKYNATLQNYNNKTMSTKTLKHTTAIIASLFITVALFAKEKTKYATEQDAIRFQSQFSDTGNNPVEPVEQTNRTYDEGVVINGVRWATRNVDLPGTFAAKPEDTGMFYQYNRNVAWAATGDVDDWDTTKLDWDESLSGYENQRWRKTSDPSPAGWRVPEFGEIQTLLDVDKVDSERATVNGINGFKFTDISTGNSMFLPAAGFRFYLGILDHEGALGYYWSNFNALERANILKFTIYSVNWSTIDPRAGLTIRPVAE